MKFTASKKTIALVAAAAMLTSVASLDGSVLRIDVLRGDRGW